MASLVAQMVKRLPAMRETQVQSLGREDALEKEMATHSSILAWKNPTDGGTWGYKKSCTGLSNKTRDLYILVTFSKDSFSSINSSELFLL